MKIADMHCDTIVEIYNNDFSLAKNKLHIDVEKMKRADYLLQNMAIFLDCTREKNPSDVAKKVIERYNSETENNNINRVYKYSDIDFDKINTMLTIEDSTIVPFNQLEEFYNLGVRMITLVWNYPNEVGFPNLDGYNLNSIEDLFRVDNDNGLTKHGIEYVKKMEELNIIVDVSHGSNKLVTDLLDVCSKPFVASHSNSYNITPVGRNLNDELILKLIEKECVMGMNFCTEFINASAKESTIEDLIKHVDHILDLGGENSIGFGSDFDGIDSLLEIKDSSNMQSIVKAFEKRYTKDIVKKICYENVLALYEKTIS